MGYPMKLYLLRIQLRALKKYKDCRISDHQWFSRKPRPCSDLCSGKSLTQIPHPATQNRGRAFMVTIDCS